MESFAQSGFQADTALSQAIERLWGRFLPEIKERIAVLEKAAEALTAQTLAPPCREAAQAAAHKLAGVLGTFGLTRGTDLARDLEISLFRESGPDPGFGQRLAAIARELREMVENRPSTAE